MDREKELFNRLHKLYREFSEAFNRKLKGDPSADEEMEKIVSSAREVSEELDGLIWDEDLEKEFELFHREWEEWLKQ